MAVRVRRIEANSRASSRKPNKNQGPGLSRKLQKNIKLVPGQKRILEYYSKVAKKEVTASISPKQGTSNGPLLGVLDLCTPRKPSMGVAGPFHEERGG